MKQEKIFAIHIFCKGLVSKIYKEFIELKSKQKKKKDTSFKKRDKGLNRHFFPKKIYRWQTGTGKDALHL